MMGKKRQTKVVDVRQRILDRLVSMKKTPHWLSCRMTTVHPKTALNYLYASDDTPRQIAASTIGEMLSLLGLDISSEAKAKPKRRQRSTR